MTKRDRENAGSTKLRRDTTLVLIDKARAGDDRALDRLCVRMISAARRWTRGRLPMGARGMLETDDIVQEMVARTAAHIRSMTPDEPHRVYLYLRRALRNRIHDEWRRVHRRPGRDETIPSQLGDDQAKGPLSVAIETETMERYEAALATLAPVERAMVVSRLEFGLSWREVAELAGKPSEDAARVAVTRTVRKLAEKLGESESGGS